MEEERQIKIKCPKCGSKNLILTETSTWATEWVTINGVFDLDTRNNNPISIERVDA